MKQLTIKKLKETAQALGTEPKVIDIENMEVEVKQFISSAKKMAIADFVANKCFIESKDCGITHDPIFEEVLRTYMITTAYTNIKLSDDFVEMADLLTSTNIFAKIENNIPLDEIELIDHAIKNYRRTRIEIEHEKRKRTFLDYLEQFTDDILPDLIKSIESFDVEKLAAMIPSQDLELLKK